MKKLLIVMLLVACVLVGCAPQETQQYTFSLVNVGEGGQAVADHVDGTYDAGTLVKLTATVTDETGAFDGYYIDGVLLSDSFTYTVELKKDTVVEARFSTNPVDDTKYEFDISIEGKGTVTGTQPGQYAKDTLIELQAKAESGYTFAGYFNGDQMVSSSSSYSFKLSDNTTLVAKFIESGDTEYVYQIYSHKFLKSDFNGDGYSTTAGSREINGINWNFDAFTFLGQSSDGIQVGSNKQPQKTPWKLTTDFGEEIIVTSISVGGKNPTGTTLNISGGTLNISETLYNDTYQTYTFDSLDVTLSSLEISLSATSKAFYFDTLTIVCMVANNSELEFMTDSQTAQPAVPGQNGVPATKYQPITKEEYYQGVDLDLLGEALKIELNAKISVMTKYSYGDDTAIMLYTDANPAKPGFLYGIYDGDDIVASNTGIWNKEHVWACSQMGLGGDARPDSSTKNKSSDLHNLRVSCQNSNGLHGNKFYDVEVTALTFFPNVTGEPNASHNYSGDHRGDVARILFYMATMYMELHLDDNLNVSDDLSMGKLSILLEWNELDPVDEFEIQRNNRIYEYQGNRNPFIDYPELADAIW